MRNSRLHLRRTLLCRFSSEMECFLPKMKRSEDKSALRTNQSITCSPAHKTPLTLNKRSDGTLVAGMLSRSTATCASLEVQRDCISTQYTMGSTSSISFPALCSVWCFARASTAPLFTLSKSSENLNINISLMISKLLNNNNHTFFQTRSPDQISSGHVS